jgi:hypothetical protein
MSTVKLTARLTDGHFAETKDGGENAVIQLTVPVLTPGQRDELSSVMAQPGPWNLRMNVRADFENEVAIGQVVGFDSDRGTFKFLVPIFNAGQTGFPRGAYVVTGGGIVGCVASYKAEATDIGRRLVETGAILPERVLVEQPAVEYTALIVGGMVTTPTGMAYYYRPPVFHPEMYGNVHAGVQGPFFVIGERNQMATHLIARMAALVGDKRLIPDAYLSAAMLTNAARHAKHAAGVEDYVDSILAVVPDVDRAREIEEAILLMPDVQKA